MIDIITDKSVLPWLIEAVIILLALTLQRPLARLVIRIAFTSLRVRRPERYELVRKTLLQPVAFLLFTGIALICAHFMPLPESLYDLINNILASLFMVAAIWTLYMAAGLVSATLLDSFRDRETTVNPTAAHFIASGIQILIVIVGLLMVLARWVTDLTGLIAGLGIGGLAIALAAQDTASNFIGSIAIMLDKPFEIGDMVEIEGILGTVERVGLRSSRIRAVDQAVVYIPNAKLANCNIINGAKRQSRRVAFKMAIARTTETQTVRDLLAKIREMLKTDPDIDDANILVSLDSVSAFSLDIFISFYTVPDYNTMMTVKERVNLALLDASAAMGVACVPAFTPSDIAQ